MAQNLIAEKLNLGPCLTMEYYLQVEFPIPTDDLIELQDRLRSAALFCCTFDTADDPYSIAIYHREAALFETKAAMLMDRNVFSRVVNLAQGKVSGPSHKLPAAVMAFAQCADILIEPNFALYEYAAVTSPNLSVGELEVFRAADNIHPRLYTDVALGRADRIPVAQAIEVQGADTLQAALSRRPHRWRFDYTALLKVALLELSSLAPHEKLLRLLEWMHQEFFFSATALGFASYYFSPKKRRRGMLKQLRSPDRRAALVGVQNAAWDLNLIGEWLRKVRAQDQDKTIWLLCSLDEALREIAKRQIAQGGDIEVDLHRLFSDDWGVEIGPRIADAYLRFQTDCESKNRLANSPFTSQDGDRMIAELEHALLTSTVSD